MPLGLKRYQTEGHLHFITFSCYRRQPTLTPHYTLFQNTLASVRKRYTLEVHGYVLMPEYGHLLISEPQKDALVKAIQASKLSVSNSNEAPHQQNSHPSRISALHCPPPPGHALSISQGRSSMIALPRRSFLRAAAALLPTLTVARVVRALDDPSPTSLPKPLAREEDRYAVKRALPNGTTTFKVSSADCRNDFFAMEHHHTAKGGPPLHRHHVEDEWFYVLEGEYRVKVGDTLHTLHAGDSVLGPRGVPHAFAFVGPTSGRMLITYAPAGRMEEFFSFQDQHGGRSYASDAERARAFGIDRLGPPLSVD